MGEIIIQSILMYGLAIVIAVLAAFLIRGIVLFLERRKAQSESVSMAEPHTPMPATEPAPASPEAGAPSDHIAAIAAAVYAALGAHRVIRIDPVGGHEAGWAVQGRWLHQTSRTPFRK